MPLNLYPNIYASGSVPDGWKPMRGGALKYPVRNPAVHVVLRVLRPRAWQKVIKRGNFGEVHYVEHSSGHVAGVKFIP